MSLVLVRPATEADGARLREIDVATWSPDTTPAPQPEADEPFFRGGLVPEDVLVAEDEGELLGYVMLHQSIPVPSHEHVLDINGLAVDPRHQGRGLGRRLVETALNEARARGVRKVALRVLGPNASARALYESCGFVTEGVLCGEFVLAGHDVDDHLMALTLEPLDE